MAWDPAMNNPTLSVIEVWTKGHRWQNAINGIAVKVMPGQKD
jgi:hypothetical protein